jgi:aminopeptidase
MPSETQLSRYAEVAIRTGVNLQPGQALLILAPLETFPLVRALTEEAYRAGASLVRALYEDQNALLIRIQESDPAYLDRVAAWEIAGLERALQEGAALLSVVAPDPDLLASVDPARLATVQRAGALAGLPVGKIISGMRINWSVIAASTARWAQKIYPGDPNGEERLWQTLFRLTRTDQPDPVASWRTHLDRLGEITSYLNARSYQALRLRGPGTDLQVGLPTGHRWLGGSTRCANGVETVPNLPTEEVFTAPDRGRVEGSARSTKTLMLNGQPIEGLEVRFREGQALEVRAQRGEELIRSWIATDPGACRLGEVALVSVDSPVYTEKTLFLNTLLDENAACHLAFGRCYPPCLPAASNDQDLEAAGGNLSSVHTDWMVGSEELSVFGVGTDGKEEPLLGSGSWVI